MSNGIQEITDSGIFYKQLHWTWQKPYYKLETAEFSEDGSFERMDYKEYLDRMSRKLNLEGG